MIENLNYNLKKFGKILFSIRKKMRLTQKDIRETTGLYSETIRKLEYGETLPSLDTMIKLSRIYFVDVHKILEECRYENEEHLQNILSKLDEISVSDELSDIDSLIDEIQLYMRNSLPKVAIDVKTKIQQFEKLIRLVKSKNDTDVASVLESERLAREAICLTHPNFQLTNMEYCLFDIIELRILIALAISLSRQDHFDSVIPLCDYIIENLKYHTLSNKQAIPVLIQALYTQAYFYYLMDNHEETIRYCNEGISISKENHNMKVLANLHFRKGVAEFLLNESTYYSSFEKSLMVFDLTDSNEMKTLYENILRERYNFTLKKQLDITS